jgi:hypothetical protein
MAFGAGGRRDLRGRAGGAGPDAWLDAARDAPLDPVPDVLLVLLVLLVLPLLLLLLALLLLPVPLWDRARGVVRRLVMARQCGPALRQRQRSFPALVLAAPQAGSQNRLIAFWRWP